MEFKIIKDEEGIVSGFSLEVTKIQEFKDIPRNIVEGIAVIRIEGDQIVIYNDNRGKLSFPVLLTEGGILDRYLSKNGRLQKTVSLHDFGRKLVVVFTDRQIRQELMT